MIIVIKRKLLASLIGALLWACHPFAWAQIERVEPPFWWADMQNETLQLMVYGSDIGTASVTSSSASVTVSEVRSAESSNYQFVSLELSDQHKPGKVELRFTMPSGVEHVLDYQFRQRVDGSRQRTGFSSKDVIYLATPDRFANGDQSNDNDETLYEKVDRTNPDGRHGGDLAGLQNSLSYLSDLGVTMVWLNPLQENNQQDYSYHGYSISDLYNIDARFGGNDALLRFTEAARKMGIGLIMDTIPNHIGLNHWWMRDLPSRDWVNNEGVFMQTSHRHEMIQDPYAPASDKRAFSDGWFVPTMPDLNQRNADLANYFIQNNIWWVEYAGLSGLRVDTLPYAEKAFTREFNRRLLQEFPNLNIVGEEWTTNPAIVSYWQAGKKNQDGFDAGTPSLMDFPLQEALIKSLTEQQEKGKGMIRLHAVLANDFQYPDPSNLVVIADNHDMSRLFTLVGEDIAAYKMALTFLMTTRGVPQLFYGTEILMGNPGTEAHGVIRSDFPGGWAGDKVNAFTGKGLSEQQLDAQRFVKTLLNWRKSASAIHSGSLVHYLPEDGVYVYFRANDQQLVMVLMNNNQEEVEVDTTRFKETSKAASSMKNVMTGARKDYGRSITVPARTAAVFELN